MTLFEASQTENSKLISFSPPQMFSPNVNQQNESLNRFINNEVREMQVVCNGIAQTANTLNSTPLENEQLSQLASLSYELLSYISKIMKAKQQSEAQSFHHSVHKNTKKIKEKKIDKRHQQNISKSEEIFVASTNKTPQSGISTMFSVLRSKNSKMGRSGQIHTCASCNTKACTQWLFAPNKLVLCNKCASKRQAPGAETGRISINSILN